MSVLVGEVKIAELRDFYDAARSLSADAFSERFGNGFFLQEKGSHGLTPPRGVPGFESIPTEPGREGASLSYLVWPVRDSERAESQAFISIGRAANNDVPIPDSSVAELHALVNRTPSGQLRLRPAPTGAALLVNGQPPRGTGALLEPGDSLELGRVALTFLDAEGLRALARRVSKRPG